jgi:phage shock protein E
VRSIRSAGRSAGVASQIAAGLLGCGLTVAACATDTTSREAHRLVAAGARLLDVRSAAEFRERHVAGSINIPVEQLDRRGGELGPKDRPVVVYCHTGARAGVAAIKLRKAGYRVYNLGSIARWYSDPRADQPW